MFALRDPAICHPDRSGGISLSFSSAVEGSLFFQHPTSNIQPLLFSSNHAARVTPAPIPNTEVKPRRAEDAAQATVRKLLACHPDRSADILCRRAVEGPLFFFRLL